MDELPLAIETRVCAYYEGKLAEHGATPKGVDWNSSSSQELRFRQLMRLVEGQSRFSLLDYGCGYGALLDQLIAAEIDCEYRGFDISPAMTAAAAKAHGDMDWVRWLAPDEELSSVDYAVASGVFNVKGEIQLVDWEQYVHGILERLNSVSRRGFAFNMLTGYSDRDRMREDLFYPLPEEVFGYCKRHFSKRVALLHDYELWEFTILVRR